MWFIFFPLLHSWLNRLFFVYHRNLSYQLFEAMAVLTLLRNTKKHLSYKDTSGGFEEPSLIQLTYFSPGFLTAFSSLFL